jgi:hypothetical protein
VKFKTGVSLLPFAPSCASRMTGRSRTASSSEVTYACRGVDDRIKWASLPHDVQAIRRVVACFLEHVEWRMREANTSDVCELCHSEPRIPRDVDSEGRASLVLQCRVS